MPKENIAEPPPVRVTGKVILADAENCENYYNPVRCLLATALRRIFGEEHFIEVYQRMFRIDDEYYEFNPRLNHQIFGTYQLIKENKLDEFRPFDFTGNVIN